MSILNLATWSLLLCSLTGNLWHSTAAPVVVVAAASLTDSLRQIARAYENTTAQSIEFNFGASSTLARQIEEGAPADLFFSADEAQMQRLQDKGLIVTSTRTNLLSNSLVIVVLAKSGVEVRAPKDLAGPAVHRVALGDPAAVPIGVYARSYLERAGLWQAIRPKIVPTENVRAALAAVESGNADASIVYKTDALISTRVRVAYTIPADEGPKILYPAALVRGARNAKAAEEFLRYLSSQSALKMFQQHGFIGPP